MDKSTTSRIIKNLEKRQLVKIGSNKDDKRYKPISLTIKGESKLKKIHTVANIQTEEALELLTDDESSVGFPRRRHR